MLGYFPASIEHCVYLQFQKDENGPRRYRKKLLFEGFAKAFPARDFRGSHGQ